MNVRSEQIRAIAPQTGIKVYPSKFPPWLYTINDTTLTHAQLQYSANCLAVAAQHGRKRGRESGWAEQSVRFERAMSLKEIPTRQERKMWLLEGRGGGKAGECHHDKGWPYLGGGLGSQVVHAAPRLQDLCEQEGRALGMATQREPSVRCSVQPTHARDLVLRAGQPETGRKYLRGDAP